MNGIDFLVDTNVLIFLHEGNPVVLPFLNYAWCCSVITEMELLGSHNLSKSEKLKLKSLLDDCIIFPFSDDIKNVTIAIRQSKKINFLMPSLLQQLFIISFLF